MPRRPGLIKTAFYLPTLLSAAIAHADDAPPALIHQIESQVQPSRIQADYEAISTFGNRLSGSSGERKTFQYFQDQMRRLGATITTDKVPIAVPDPAATANLKLKTKSATLYPLWPNLVRTSTCHVTGLLVYGGRGTLEELNNHTIKGSIVLEEFGAGSNWRNAAGLGAAAIVFIQPDSMTRAEAEAKFSNVPLSIPRFYLPLKDAGPALTAAFKNESAKLDCTQNWLDTYTQRVTATMPGTESNQPAIVLYADSDSISVVPGLNPGAEGIGSIATLLELARIAQQNPHKRPIQFALAGGHAEALLGAREAAEHEFDDPSPPLLILTFDLSSGSPAIGSFGRGWFYEFRDEQEWADQHISANLHAYAVDMAKVDGVNPSRLLFVDAVNNGDARTWKNNIPGKFALDCEPLVLAGLNAITYRTIDDGRDRLDTPFDTLDKVRISNVVRQIRTSAVLLNHLADDPLSRSMDSHTSVPLEPVRPARSRLIGGFATLTGQVVSYDPNKSFIPDTPQTGSLACAMGRDKTFMGVRGDCVQYTTGPKAVYRIDGLAASNSYATNTDIHETYLQAYHLDPKTGAVDLAPTWNLPGFDAYDTFFLLTTTYRESPIVVFPSVNVDLYGMCDPQTLQAMTATRLWDGLTGSWPRNFSIAEPPMDTRMEPDVDDAQVLFMLPGQNFMVTSGTKGNWQELVLTDSSFGNEKGVGYTAPQGNGQKGKPNGTRADLPLGGIFPQIPLNAAIDLDAINATRLNEFRKYRIISPDIAALEAQAQGEIKAAQDATAKKNWAESDRHSRAAWGFALRAHPIIMSTANDVVNGVIFYLFLLIPFSYFVERLVKGESLLIRQLGWVVGIFIASFLLLRLIHPAFQIVSNPSMIFIAFVMGALSLIVTFFVVGKFERSMSAVRALQVGVHEVDIKRSSVAMAAFNLGVSNMRRRKARTFLTTLTLVVMTFIVLSFTSIVSRLRLDETPSANPAAYSGILVRTPGLDPLQLATYREVQNEFAGQATVVRRAYYYGADIADTGVITLKRGENVTDLRAVVGLDPGEAGVLQPQTALTAGRWFKPGERNVAILPEPVAESLKISPAELGRAHVTFAGTEFTVIGIANSSVLRSLHDLDGDGVMPADFTLSKTFQQEKATSNQAFRSFIRLDPSLVFLIPAERAMELGADLRSVAIRFIDPSQTRPALTSLMPRLSLNLYAGVPSPDGGLEVKEFSVQQGSASAGVWLVVIQLAIAAVFVLNTMIASVFERTREIAIFSSIGLAPNHISMLFFAESLVYGILGAVIGYFVAQATARIIVMTNSLPGLVLNFSSTSAVLSAGVVMAVVLGSTIYPARKAAKIAAPAVNEEVFEAKPEGDTWDLPLPFSVGAAEAAPIARFLEHWLKSYEGYTIGEFVTSGAALESHGEIHKVSATMWLAPFDLGVSQRFELTFSPSAVPGIYLLDLRLTRLSGDVENWPTVNRRFLANIRKQFLTWRTLAPADRAPYESTPEPQAA